MLWSALSLGAGAALFVAQYVFFNLVRIPAHFYKGPVNDIADICADTLRNRGSGDYYFFVTGRCRQFNSTSFTYRQELDERHIPVIDEVTLDGDCSLLRVDIAAGGRTTAVVTTNAFCRLVAPDKTSDTGRYEIHPDGTIEKVE